MASIRILGDAVVVTSAVKLDDIKKVQTYRPDALVLNGGEDGKEPVFKLAVGEYESIGKYGVSFAKATHDDEKLATMTMVMSAPENATADDIKASVADSVGEAIANLNKIEAAIPNVIAEVDAERAAIMASITVQ